MKVNVWLFKVVDVSALCLSTSKVKGVEVFCLVVLLGICFFCSVWGCFTICRIIVYLDKD